MLVGRADELALIEALIARHAPAGRGVLFRGDPGVGKTALLDAAAARADTGGMRVLRVRGVEFESEIGFSALHELLYPVRDRAERLAAHHHDALAQVFDLAPGPARDPPVIAAVLALLGRVAAERPLLVIVDDVPWIDRASATVLGFAARRIDHEPIRFLAAVRAGVPGLFDRVGLSEREIGPLAEQPAAALLDACWPGLAPAARQRLLDDAAGNPLALLELPGTLTDGQRRGQDPLPAFLPLSGRLEATFAGTVRDLPSSTRNLLLLATLESDADLSTIRAAAGNPAEIDDVDVAQRAGLVRVDAAGGRIALRHPLIASAVAQCSSAAELRSAHQALAAAQTGLPERRWRHLAEAATGPDEPVARALEEAARSAYHRGHGRAAVTALVRAGELSPDPADRSRRLARAAFVARLSSPLDEVNRLLADARHTDGAERARDAPARSVFAAATAGYLAQGVGDVNAAQRLLAQALEDSVDSDGDGVEDLLYVLLFVCIYAARDQLWELFGGALDRFDRREASALRLCYNALTDPVRVCGTLRGDLARAFDALPADAGSWQLLPLAYAALQVDALSDHRHLCWQVIERERAGGASGVVIGALLVLSADAAHHGRWAEAATLAERGLDLAGVHGQHMLQRHLRCQLAYIGAARGNTDLVQTLSDDITGWAAPHGVGLPQAMVWRARAVAALGRGDYEDAYLYATRINPPGTVVSGFRGPWGSWTVMDLVEAAVRTGRTDEARAHVTAARQAGIACISPRIALITAGAAALAADDDHAGPLFDTALSLPEADRWPFEQARIQLAYGQWLRRTRATTPARRHLTVALETFDRLGARPWAERARNELRATGVATAGTPAAALTTQERQIATLAATGMTNKQIGQQLFLSHRTVSGHLHRIFPKLGITSRAALRDALESVAPDEDDGHSPLPG
ncbi:LuxR family transcriptional regulator [Dactylosporangium sp. NPDC005572]|uniref:helix-turn-helix transcriptional regulator n=1 Tax=Dactylosporangium sp. NPDC005572 TaxID=3156889 RepID=UPI0033A03473